jgi:predicted RNA-binding protein with PIN domain
VVTLPAAETERRWKQTTYEWPIVNAVFHGVSQNQFMARHRANHVNVAYTPSGETADKALATKAAMLADLGITVHLCGSTKLS